MGLLPMAPEWHSNYKLSQQNSSLLSSHCMFNLSLTKGKILLQVCTVLRVTICSGSPMEFSKWGQIFKRAQQSGVYWVPRPCENLASAADAEPLQPGPELVCKAGLRIQLAVGGIPHIWHHRVFNWIKSLFSKLPWLLDFCAAPENLSFGKQTPAFPGEVFPL